jgi:hypothetical protein
MWDFHIQQTTRLQYSRNFFEQSWQNRSRAQKMVGMNRLGAGDGQRAQNLKHTADQIDAGIIEPVDANGIAMALTQLTPKFQCNTLAMMQTLGDLDFIDESHWETLPRQRRFACTDGLMYVLMIIRSGVRHLAKPNIAPQ